MGLYSSCQWTDTTRALHSVLSSTGQIDLIFGLDMPINNDPNDGPFAHIISRHRSIGLFSKSTDQHNT